MSMGDVVPRHNYVVPKRNVRPFRHVIVVDEPRRSTTTIGVMTRRVPWQGKSLNFHELETRPLSTNGCTVKGMLIIMK